MIVMFIFLGLTVIFVIATAIYLNKKKDNKSYFKTEYKDTYTYKSIS